VKKRKRGVEDSGDDLARLALTPPGRPVLAQARGAPRRKVQTRSNLLLAPKHESQRFPAHKRRFSRARALQKYWTGCASVGETEGMNEPFASTILATVETDGRTAQRLADGLMEALDPGGTAIAAFEAANGTWTVEVYFEHTPDEPAVRRLVADLAGEPAGQALAFSPVAARDWVAASLDGLPPVKAGRFFVHGAHHRKRVPPNRIGIEIEAALAFGTGHHGTTRGCLLALDRIAKARRARPAPPLPARGERVGVRGRFHESEPRRISSHTQTRGTAPSPGSLARSDLSPYMRRGEGWRVLDVGTGTGVLAIAAARALRGPVIAGDIDPVSVRLARENARLNRAPALAIIHARGLADRRFRDAAPYHLVFANILLGPLKGLAKPIAALAAPGAFVVLSGLLPPQANAALAAYRAHGLVLERRIPLEGWMTLMLRRPALRRPVRR
jgi:ribosomal protein L11 methyltransferase